MQPTEKLLPTSKTIVYNVDMNDWDPDHRHWDHPSNAVIYSDGSVFIFAHHLANMLRTCPISDCGSNFAFGMNFTFFQSYDAVNNRCAGSALASQDFTLRSLDYRDEVWDVSSTGQLAQPDVLNTTECLQPSQWIR
jgi:hypothetical protein